MDPQADWRGPIVGAPVCTRTASHSLTVSFLPPGCRVCSFDCVYCAYEPAEGSVGWRAPGEIEAAVARALTHAGTLDSVTISGTGEPTHHPQFGRAVAGVLAARQLRPYLPVRIATNGMSALRPAIRRVLDLLDERIVRVDAGGERIDRPASGVALGAVVAGLGLLRDVSVESIFVGGRLGNMDDGTVEEWIELLAELRPRRVYVATTVRAPGDGVRPASRSALHAIAGLLQDQTGIRATVVP